jgi:hypothetical protein
MIINILIRSSTSNVEGKIAMEGHEYVPLGYVQLTVGGTIGGLSGTAGQFVIPALANRVLMSAETTNLRWRDDGGPLASGVGFLLSTGLAPFDYSGNLSNLRFISSGAAGILNVAYYRDVG